MPFDNAERPGPGRGTGERAINLPPAVLWLIGINVAVQLLRYLLSDDADHDPHPAVRPGAGQLHRRRPRSAVAGAGAHHLPVPAWRLDASRRQHDHAGRLRRAGRAPAGRAPLRRCSISRPASWRASSMSCFFPDSTDPVIGASGVDQRRVRRRADADALRRQPAVAAAGRRHLDRASTSSSASSAARRARPASRSPGPPISAASSTACSPFACSCRAIRVRRRRRTRQARRHGRPAGPAAPLPRGQRRGVGAVLRRARRALLVGRAGRPAGPDRHGRHRRRDHLPGAALSRLAGPLRALRRRAVGRARAGDAAAVLRAGHRGAGDGGGHALDRLAPPARLDRQSRGLGAGHRRRPARSADRRRPPAPHRAHQPRGARAARRRSAPSATCRRRSASRSSWRRSTGCWRPAPTATSPAPTRPPSSSCCPARPSST